MFDSSDFAWTEAGRAEFAIRVGDRKLDYDEMKQHSPVYRVSEMETPVLIIHGDEDVRVDIEHAYRLIAMLDLHQKEYERYIVEGLGHSDWSRSAVRAHHERLMRFLWFHLE